MYVKQGKLSARGSFRYAIYEYMETDECAELLGLRSATGRRMQNLLDDRSRGSLIGRTCRAPPLIAPNMLQKVRRDEVQLL